MGPGRRRRSKEMARYMLNGQPLIGREGLYGPGSKAPPMPRIDPRDEQMFPKFGSAEIDRLRRFGKIRRYTAGGPLFATGDIAPRMFVLAAVLH